MAEHNELGKSGEDHAYDYLLKKGFDILERNWRHKKDEVDIIAVHRDCLVIVEVRYRTERAIVAAGQTIDNRKQQKLIRTAAMFLAWNDEYATLPLRFDVVGIDTDANGKSSINWIRDAFRPADARL